MTQLIKWQKGFESLFHADAQTVGKEILSIGDKATPEQIVEKARDERTELHKCFDWDNDVAADKWRLHQARQVICHLVIQPIQSSATQPEIRFFHKTDNKTGYKALSVIITQEDEYQKLLQRAWAELRAFKQKYACLSELFEILDLIQ